MEETSLCAGPPGYLLLVLGPTAKMDLSFPGSKLGPLDSPVCPEFPPNLCLPPMAHKAHFAISELLFKFIFGSAIFWTDTPISPGFSWQPSEVFPCSPPDSHMFQQVLRALYQDDAIKWGVLTYHATGTILAHHKLQWGRGR